MFPRDGRLLNIPFDQNRKSAGELKKKKKKKRRNRKKRESDWRVTPYHRRSHTPADGRIHTHAEEEARRDVRFSSINSSVLVGTDATTGRDVHVRNTKDRGSASIGNLPAPRLRGRVRRAQLQPYKNSYRSRTRGLASTAVAAQTKRDTRPRILFFF